jgi:hypothetical protein
MRSPPQNARDTSLSAAKRCECCEPSLRGAGIWRSRGQFERRARSCSCEMLLIFVSSHMVRQGSMTYDVQLPGN